MISGTAASAYTLQQAAKPAEFPPASYRGDVYVDSRGCAYVRANIGTRVNWVPRISGDRKSVVCGLTPTANVASLASSRPPAPPAPPAPTAAPVSLAAAPPTVVAPPAVPTAAPVAAPSSTAITRTMTVTCPAGGETARVRIGSGTVSVQCAPGQTTPKSYIVRHPNGERTRLIAEPAPAAAAPAPVVAAPRAPATSYGQAASSSRVRMGGVAPGGATNNFGNGYGFGNSARPAGPAPSAGAVTARPAAPARVPAPAVTVAPPATAAPRAGGSFGNGYGIAPNPDAGRVYIPSGYRPAWEDDRLNPNRGPRSAAGDMQMASRWDVDSIPMREVSPTAPQGLIAQTGGSGLHLFTKSPTAETVAVARPAATAPAHRYVQVGAFSVAANAERAAQKLKSLGLPGRVAKTVSGRNVVIAGPFDDVAALRNALAVARRGGFSDAFLRS